VAEQGPAGAPPGGAGRASLAVLVLATCAAHATSFQGGFQFDDWRVIVGDPRVQSVAAWWGAMPGIRPLLKLTYALNVASGAGLVGFHAVNLLVHLASAILAWRLLLALGQRLRPLERFGAGALPPWTALLGALLFSLHPVQVESVTYLSGRSSSLAGALALASAVAFVVGRERGRGLLVHLASPLLMVASLLVKEGAIVLPAALLLLEAVDLRRPFSWRAALWAVSAHLAVAALAAGALLAAPTYRSMLAGSLSLRSPLAEVLTHARAVAWLTGQLVPLRGLVADPGLAPVAGWSTGAALAALGIAGAAVAGLLLLRRSPVPSFATCWFLCWLAPQGWWLPRPELASERQLYLALLGPAWLVAVIASWPAWPRALRLGAAAALVAILGATTAVRSRVYRDEVTFWSDVVRKAPASARGHANLGYALALACRPGEAEAELVRAAALDPDDVRVRVNLRLLREGALLPEGQVCPERTR
jgi:protein O-mannosyl-transferase